VDRLSARNLPLGVFQQIEPETIHRQLQDGDYIIMLSDGSELNAALVAGDADTDVAVWTRWNRESERKFFRS
jgi:hypothetical protein